MHQFSSKVAIAGYQLDGNWSPYELDELFAVGIPDGPVVEPEPPIEPDPDVAAAKAFLEGFAATAATAATIAASL